MFLVDTESIIQELETMKAISENISIRREVADLVMKYNWQTPEDGKRMLGWLACALVSDSLRHRPHIWLSGYPSKSWFMDHVQYALHQHRSDFHHSPSQYHVRTGKLPPQVIDMADYRDVNNQIIAHNRRKVKKVIQACRAASGRFDRCGEYGPLCFSACLMSWNQPDMTRYETRQFAPVRLKSKIQYEEFSRYEAEIDRLLGDSAGLAMGLQKSILESAGEIAELAIRLDHQAGHDGSDDLHKVEINAIRGALSAGWQWWSGTDELLGYWKGERPIDGDQE
ncbi:MAG: hypothetical protein OXE44_01870 [Nitrospinae bacterium]|nr:hypothetical protein [Nitrospinota bacterium]